MGDLDKLRRLYEDKREEIDVFLKRCAARGQSTDAKELFKWLCCNLLASQAKWEEAKGAVDYLDSENRLFGGDPASIQDGLKNCGYKSPNNKEKAKWLYDARRRFYDEGCGIGIVDFVHMLGVLCGKDPIGTRNLLADSRRDNHISGLGMKGASHFLRGLGVSHDQLAILDTHIMGWLEKFRVVEDLPRNAKGKIKNPTKKQYLCYEK